MTKWQQIMAAYQAKGGKAGVLHDCHNGCASAFGGPTLVAKPCNASDPAQHWSVDVAAGANSGLVNGANGMCAGCGDGPLGDCANGALAAGNGTGVGLGMQACITKCTGSPPGPDAWPQCVGYGLPSGLGKQEQTWNYSTADATLRLALTNDQCLGLSPGGGDQVIIYNTFNGGKKCGAAEPTTQWIPGAADTSSTASRATGAPAMTLFKLKSNPAQCLSSAGEVVVPVPDPWCLANNNMWRSNTDVLQVWTRTMIEVESMATQGGISRPGAWSFPDCLELGVAGEGTYTWNEASKSIYGPLSNREPAREH